MKVKNFKFKDDKWFLDSKGILHNKVPLNKILDYSIEEQIIGRWIDGSTIYRRIFTGTFTNEQILMNNILAIIDIHGYGDVGTNTTRTIPFVDVYEGKLYRFTVDVYQNNARTVSIRNGSPYNFVGTIVLDYIKK